MSPRSNRARPEGRYIMRKRIGADVAIIGGGVAGLAAARILADAGLTVRILEARDRIGGRVHSRIDPVTGLPVELGAEFIHGIPAETFELIDAGSVPIYEVSGEHWRSAGGKLSPMRDFWGTLENVNEKMSGIGRRDISYAEYLEKYAGGGKNSAARALAQRYVEGFHAARIETVGVKGLLRAENASEKLSGDRAFRMTHQYANIAALILSGDEKKSVKNATEISIDLETIVQTINWKKGRITIGAVSAAGAELEPISARRALITLPLGVLKSSPGDRGAIAFAPDLPEKRAAWDALEMGDAVRIVLRFRDRFWERRGFGGRRSRPSLEGMSFLHSDDPGFPTWWSCFPIRAPMLTGWAGGPAATRLLELDDSGIVAEAVASLARILGTDSDFINGELETWYVHNWKHDPFSRGAYSFVSVNGLAAQKRLAAPVAETLFFAGEALSMDGNIGTVHGAIASGRRAAMEILTEC
ncbi:MAG: Flavin containing amine oxidoreductase [Chlorobi bacterium]|nr:Flavin containing amine oxidoreductase [Chlorobiota bacterium]